MAVDISSAPWFMAFVAMITVLLATGTFVLEYRRAKKIHRRPSLPYKKACKIAVLIASKDGEKTIAKTVRAAKSNKCDIFVVSDGSKDQTVIEAKQAGAQVLALRKNVGKPTALHRGYKYFKLGQRYDAVAILDDDIIIEPGFISQSKKIMARDVAIVVGKNLTDWPDNKRWNIWLATRAYSYWLYQVTIRSVQSAYNVMNCISGSNSVYRCEVLDKVLIANTPYIVDDTYWTLETHRLKLGRIVYAPKARAWIQDPTNFRDWYRQNLRWMWGTFQGILGHRIGTKFNAFQLAFLMLILEWIIYVASGPIVVWLIWHGGLKNLPFNLTLLLGGYAAWVLMAAAAMKRPKLILFVPAIVVIDMVYRVIMVHSFVKALRYPSVESCVWDSPKRLETRLITNPT